MAINDPLGAFVKHVDITLPGARTGPLAGLRFAVKDIFDIAGHVTGAGNPDWLETHSPAMATAPAVETLVAAGATMVGKTITDELAYSLNGQNFHYGTPENANAPRRIPGGSSSGSAAAVAGGLVDFALGSDTGGSVRLPASLCGIYGMRPSHGRIPAAGVVPLAPSFDVVGWFARDADLLARVGAALLGPDPAPIQPGRLLIAEDAFALADEPVRAAVTTAMEAAAALLGPGEPVEIGREAGGAGNQGLQTWMSCFRILQAREIWDVHGAWIEATEPRFGPEIAARFAWAKSVAESMPVDEVPRREAFATRLDTLLADGAVLCLPTAPDIAPLRDLPADALHEFRDRVLSLTCIAGLARLPQVSIPAARVEGCPVGLSLVARRGADRALLDLVREVAKRLG